MSLLVVFMFVSQGCTYFRNRGEDFAEMVDLGISVSSKPCIGLYWNSLDVLVAGYCNIEGHFIGWGGNQFGVTPLYAKCYGLIVSQETVGWGDFDKDDPDTLYMRYGGLAGLASIAGVGSDTRRPTPDYTPACVHFIPHIGYVGLVWNARWMEIVDFIVGWTTIDIAGDDGYRFGKWPGQTRWRD